MSEVDNIRMEKNAGTRFRGTDLTGKRFGKLTVIACTDKRKNNYLVWKCRCDCGKTIEVPSRALKNGWKTDCGCVPRYEDLTGKRFGMLVVEGTGGRKPVTGKKKKTSDDAPDEVRSYKGAVLWRCRCDCGGTVLTTTSQLKAGYQKSCGCLSRPPLKDWLGVRFGKLTVVSYDGKRKGSHFWKCQCDCGNTVSVAQSSLKNEHTKSCGCIVDLMSTRNFFDGTCIENIRSKKISARNTSGVRGVYPVKKRGTWAAQITLRGKTRYLGQYETVTEAAAARKEAEVIFDEVLEKFDRKALGK